MVKPSIMLKIVSKEGKELQRIRSRKSRCIFSAIQREDFSDCMFTVSVAYACGVNKTDFQNKEETLKALRAFLEK